MKKLLVVVILLAAAAIVIAVWARTTPRVAVHDVRQAETLILGKETGTPAWGISIRGSGHIDGEATISLLLQGQRYRVVRLSGPVDFEWGGDWYAETAEVRYEPGEVRSGALVLHYRIYQ